MSEDNKGTLATPDAELCSMQRVKIALFTCNFRIGGAERQVFELARLLDRRKYEVVVIALRGEGELKEPFHSLPDSQVISLDGQRPLRAFVRLIRLIRDSEIRVIHSFLVATNVYSLFAKLFLHRAKFIIGLRNSLSDSTFGCNSPYLRMKVRMLDLCLGFLRRHGDLYISNSEAGKAVYEQRLRVRVTVVPNGIDTERFKPDETARSTLRRVARVPTGIKLVGILANCTVYKDYPTFVRAARIIMDRVRDVHFISIGEDRTPVGAAVKSLVQESDLQSAFHFLGTRQDVSELLPGLDVLCSSSVTEGFSNSVAEAMACGVPCVVTDVGDSRRIVGSTGIVVPPGNPESLALSIITLLNMNPTMKQRVCSAARQRILENFDASVMVKHHERLYESLLSGSCSDDLVRRIWSSNFERKTPAERRKTAETFR